MPSRGMYRPRDETKLSLVNIQEMEDERFRVTVKRRTRGMQEERSGTFATIEEATSYRDMWRRELHLPAADDAAAFLRPRTGIDGLARALKRVFFSN